MHPSPCWIGVRADLHGELAGYPGGAGAGIAVVEDPGIAQGGDRGVDLLEVERLGVGSRGQESRSKGISSH